MRSAPMVALLALSCALLAGSAAANGRFPRAQRLLEVHDDPNVLVLSATYGVLVTADRGATWRHLCELGFAFSINDVDPLVEMPADGSMLIQVSRSLNRANAPFCDFQPVLGGVGSERVIDMALDRNDTSRLLALLLKRGEDGGVENRLYGSDDSGQNFTELGAPLPEALAFPLTFDEAPSDPSRLYVSGADAAELGVLLRSDDRGQSYEISRFSVESGEYPYIAKVDPENPDALYVRTDGWRENDDGMLVGNDALLYSDDGGSNFRELHRQDAKLFGFALSPDGSEILIGYGDPVEPSRSVDSGALGIYRASTADHVFTKIFEGSVSCLAWTQAGVYACTAQNERGFALGFAPAADFDLEAPEPLSPLLDLTKVLGPLACPRCSSGDVCRATWTDNCAIFGASCAAISPSDDGDESCSQGGAGGASPTEIEGGASGHKSNGDAEPIAKAREPSCGCGVQNATSTRVDAWFLIAAIGSLIFRRRAATV